MNGKENANENVNVLNGNASVLDAKENGRGRERNNVREKGGNVRRRRKGNSKKRPNGSEKGGTRNAVRWRDVRWSARDCFTRIDNT